MTSEDIPVFTLGQRIERVRAGIAAAEAESGRSPGSVTLVAVTKNFPASAVRAAHALGITTFGENRVQEAEAKIAELADLPDIRWELIGHLQSNKAARAVRHFRRIQSIDRLRLAHAVDAHAAEFQRIIPVLLEVNIGGEATKSGFAPDDLLDAAAQVVHLRHLLPEGLMTVAPAGQNVTDLRAYFHRMRDLRDQLRERFPIGVDGGWRELSMGMSDDFEAAIAEGATIVRSGVHCLANGHQNRLANRENYRADDTRQKHCLGGRTWKSETCCLDAASGRIMRSSMRQ